MFEILTKIKIQMPKTDMIWRKGPQYLARRLLNLLYQSFVYPLYRGSIKNPFLSFLNFAQDRL
jgi:hypothetical protein